MEESSRTEIAVRRMAPRRARRIAEANKAIDVRGLTAAFVSSVLYNQFSYLEKEKKMKTINSIVGELPTHHKQGVILALRLATEFEKELLKEKTDVTSPLPKTAYDNKGEEYVPCVGQPLSNLKPIPYEQPVFKNGKIYYGD